jgi:hypothetical protein
MAFTYDTTNDIGRLRFLISDTTDPPNFQDAELQLAIEFTGGLLPAAASCCESLARRMMQKPDEQIGDYKVDRSKTATNLLDMAKRYRTADEEAPAFAIAEDNVSTFSELQILRNQILKDACW